MSGDERREVPAEAFPARSEKILWREVDGSVVLFHEDTGRAFALNETAARVWKLCDGALSVRQVAARLGETYGMDDALEVVTGLVEKLSRDGCVELADTQRQAPGPKADGTAPPPPAAWREPVMEEIVFAKCDCSASPRGTMKISLCTSTTPKKAQS